MWDEHEVVDGELVARDLPEFLHVLEEMKEKMPVVTRHVEQLLSHVTSPESCSTENGISLLEVKVQLLLSSLVNLVQLILMKTDGENISASPPVLRLVEIRTVLEKLRPLDQKLRYQVDKLIRMSKTGLAAAPGNDPLRFRANPSNMVAKLGNEEREASEESEEEGEAKLYVPPRVVAMPYDGDDGEGVKEKKRKKRVQSSIVQELRNEYLDLPEEVNDVGSGFRSHRETKEEKEREMFEEAHFIRLPKKRKGQGSRQRGGANDVLDNLDLGEFPSGPAHQPGNSKRRGTASVRRRLARGPKSKRQRHK